MRAPEEAGAFDAFDPRHVAPLVAYLASEDCPLTGKVFAVQGGWIAELEGWRPGPQIEADGDWCVDRIAAALSPLPTP